jgi:hypothetical protein
MGDVDLVVPAGANRRRRRASAVVGTITDKTNKTFERGNPHRAMRARIDRIRLPRPVGD